MEDWSGRAMNVGGRVKFVHGPAGTAESRMQCTGSVLNACGMGSL